MINKDFGVLINPDVFNHIAVKSKRGVNRYDGYGRTVVFAENPAISQHNIKVFPNKFHNGDFHGYDGPNLIIFDRSSPNPIKESLIDLYSGLPSNLDPTLNRCVTKDVERYNSIEILHEHATRIS